MPRPFGTAGAAILLTIGLIAFAPAPFAANDTPLSLADLAWDRGEYPTALNGYLQILDSPHGDTALESIALRTGELYKTTEVTTDGAVPQFSRDGRHFLYEVGAATRRIIRVFATSAAARPIVELNGWSASFSPDNATLAYLKTPESPDITAAQTALDTAAAADRAGRTAALADLLNAGARVTLRDLASGVESSVDTGAVAKGALVAATDGLVVFTGAAPNATSSQIYIAGRARAATPVTSDATVKTIVTINSPGTALAFTARPPGAGRGGRGGGGAGAAGAAGTGTAADNAGGGGAGGAGGGGGTGRGGGAAPTAFSLLSLPGGTITNVNGTAPSFSADGGTFVYVARTATENSVMVAPTSDPAAPSVVRKGPERVDAPAASADGSRVAYQMMPRDDWEIFTAGRDGAGETRVTRDIQHDLLPQFLTSDRLLSVVGEARHRRSFIYDLGSNRRIRLFHNNTVRTIAPEYSWEPNADGSKLLIVAERDGDTVSAERGVYLIDLSQQVTRADVRARVAASLAAEEALRAKGKRLYAPMAEAVRDVVSQASAVRIYGYEKALFDFDSKHISRPGNKLASAYLFDTYKSFGYAPEFQWFERQNALGGRTANVVATLRGTVNPELIYVVSSHYDSVAIGPGADDDSSGTAALLETARLLADRPQPATIVFASFTGEEAGLLGSREFVRRAVADKLADRRRAEQRHGRLGERLSAGQHHPLLESRHPRHPARGGDAVLESHHLRRALLQGHRRGRVLRSVRRHRRRHRLVPRAQQSALPPVARRPGKHEPSAHHRGREDDGGHADAARVESVAADGAEGHELCRRIGCAVLEAQPGARHQRLRRDIRSTRQARRETDARERTDGQAVQHHAAAQSCR